MSINTNIQQKFKGITIRLLIVVSIILLLLFVFIAITDEMVLEKENNLDFKIFHFLSAYTGSTTTRIMSFITFFGSSYFLGPAYILLMLYYFFCKKNHKATLNIIAIGITSTALLFFLKSVFQRHRPSDPLLTKVNGFSYPSGHAFCSFTFFGMLVYAVWISNSKGAVKCLLTVLFFITALLIGVSRVYLHVHYASDVVAGFCLSIVWLSSSLWLLHKMESYKDTEVQN